MAADANYDPNVSTAVSLGVISPCDVSRDGSTSLADVQEMIDEVLGVALPANDWNDDGAVNVADVQIVMNAAAGFACSAPQP